MVAMNAKSGRNCGDDEEKDKENTAFGNVEDWDWEQTQARSDRESESFKESRCCW